MSLGVGRALNGIIGMKDAKYYVGVDLGYSHDFSTCSAIERTLEWHEVAQKMVNRYRVFHLRRFPLQTEYPVIVKELASLMRNEKLIAAPMIVDASGPGLPVLQMMRVEKMSPIGIVISSGATASQDSEGNLIVPRTLLLTGLMIAFQTGILKVTRQLDLATALKDEMAGLRIKIRSRTGRTGIETDEEHDDLAMCVALPLWWAMMYDNRIEELISEKGDETLQGYNPLTR